MVRAGQIAEAHDAQRAHAASAVALDDMELSINFLEAFSLAFAESGRAPGVARLLGATTALRKSAELLMSPPDEAMLAMPAEAEVRSRRCRVREHPEGELR